MRILVDTNILFSAILFPNSKVAHTLLHVTEHHDMVLCDHNISKLFEVLYRKKPEKLTDAKILLDELTYELIPAAYQTNIPTRDVKDQPILNAAIAANVDIILTGDKDFLSLDLDSLKCMSVYEFSVFEDLKH